MVKVNLHEHRRLSKDALERFLDTKKLHLGGEYGDNNNRFSCKCDQRSQEEEF